MKKELTELVFIIDRSGFMSGLENDGSTGSLNLAKINGGKIANVNGTLQKALTEKKERGMTNDIRRI